MHSKFGWESELNYSEFPTYVLAHTIISLDNTYITMCNRFDTKDNDVAQEKDQNISTELNIRTEYNKNAISVQITSLGKLSITIQDATISLKDHNCTNTDKDKNLNPIYCITELWVESWVSIFGSQITEIYFLWNTNMIWNCILIHKLNYSTFE